MECRTWSEALTAYMDQELPQEQVQQIEKHLDSCPECDGEYRSLFYSYEVLNRFASGIELNPGLWTRIESKIVSKPKAELFFDLRSLFSIRWVPLAVAAALAVGFAVPFFWNSDQSLNVEARFNSWVESREQIERRHYQMMTVSHDAKLDEVFPNPFARQTFDAQNNPFSPE
ncbi:MAG: anti-sigma factor family protein [Acidobacteriota bacterium]